MRFGNIQIINEAIYTLEISHIFRYSSALFKNISEHKYKRGIKIPDQINISTVAMNDKIKYDLVSCSC